jgi:hypothetical protein
MKNGTIEDLEIDALVIVVLRGGVAYFGRVVAVMNGICFIGGDWCCFHPGAAAVRDIVEVQVFRRPLPAESEFQWRLTVGL